ncbi:MAG: PHP domain-containing protein [Nitrospirae bacterium]|nr:PHP domain-containing protein [Nitrospirota bacterium]
MRAYRADLHIHTCLSPCAEIDITPKRIVDAALNKGLDIIAISDHNSAENTQVAVRIGIEKGLTVLPAMEITTSEEAHVLAIFGEVPDALAMQEVIYRTLPEGYHDEERLGYQLIVNENDEILEFCKRMFFGATGLPVKELVDKIHSFGGIAVASHIDREYFSVVSQLGFIPPDVVFDGLEISAATSRKKAEAVFGDYASFPWITSSDSHSLDNIGRRYTSFSLETPSFEEFVKAFKGERSMVWDF